VPGTVVAAFARGPAPGQRLSVSAAGLDVTLTARPGAQGDAFLRSTFGPALNEGPRYTVMSGLSFYSDWVTSTGKRYQAARAKRLAGLFGDLDWRGVLVDSTVLAGTGSPPLGLWDDASHWAIPHLACPGATNTEREKNRSKRLNAQRLG